MTALSVAPFPCCSVSAADLGTRGTVWAVAEDDLLAWLRARAHAWGENGGLERHRKAMLQRTRRYVNAPPAVPGFAKATRSNTRLHDPSMTLTRDLADEEGRVFARAGQRINPLDYVALSRDLIFINGNDKGEVSWALEQEKATVILIAGPVMALQKHHGRRLYFDQKGLLAQHFGLTRTPSRISQAGRMLQISEIAFEK